MAAGFTVNRAALQEAAQGIDDAVGGLKGLGFDELGDAGRGFALLSLSGLQAGHADVQQAFSEFCGRWSFGVRWLVQDGTEFAARLGANAGKYADTEEYLTGLAKNVTDSLVGDPHLSDQQAAKVSWSQDAGFASTPESRMSWKQAEHAAEASLSAEGRDVRDHGIPELGIPGRDQVNVPGLPVGIPMPGEHGDAG